jgi:hypothetical protein
MELRNWLITNMYGDHRISGDIYGDTRGKFKDGDNVVTSPLKSIDFDARVAKTKNSIYALGDQAGGTRMMAREENTNV